MKLLSSIIDNKRGFFGNHNELIAKIGDSYVDFNAQKKMTLISKKNNDKSDFSKRSIFGNLANYLLDIAKKNINLILWSSK